LQEKSYLLRFLNRCNAKYLWKRIPQNVKNSHAELAFVWKVGQKMWQRDFPGVYAALSVDWSENVRHIMQALLGELLNTCGVWHSCIKLPELKNCGIVDVHCYITLAQSAWLAELHSFLLPTWCA